jgi:hypothetical protein
MRAKAAFLLFDIVSTTFIPGKISSEKGVEVKVIAEPRGFYVMSVMEYIPVVIL